MKVDQFSEKLNKLSGTIYTIEEKAVLVHGVYEAELKHDNINLTTLAVYTGPGLTGERLESFALSTPSMTPWKKIIRIHAENKEVYISYETEGDTIEAGDINQVQQAIILTQQAHNDEAKRALRAEENLAAALTAETARALQEESKLAAGIGSEIKRAESCENRLEVILADEKQRAEHMERVNASAIDAEIARAKLAEKELTDGQEAETTRALAAEKVLTDHLSMEQSRAEAADVALDKKKANADEVNRELANRYTKSEVYTRDEVMQKLKALAGAAPAGLDTFEELASALGNDPDFAGTIRGMLDGKVDKEAGRQLSANDYSDREKAIVADVNTKKHTHENQLVLDQVTQVLMDHWATAYAHVGDAVRHVADKERANWNESYGKRHSHLNKTVLDGLSQTLVQTWNTVSNKVDKVSGKQLSANDYTTAEKEKLDGIAPGANVNIQPDWKETNQESDAYIKNKPLSMPASDVASWAKASTKPIYSWTEIKSHPTKLSQFSNDVGYITANDVDTSKNHTHENKSILDKITQTLLNQLSAAYSHIGNKGNPHGVTAAQVGAAAVSHTHGKSQITDFPSSMPANGGNATTVNGHTVNANVPAGAKFTDTVYTHPSSGVAAGTYRSLTVNVQGHVTAGTNPTTLAGYGITDASAKSHNHDSVYLKRGGLTWGDLEG